MEYSDLDLSRAIVRHHLKSPEERIAHAERQIEHCLENQKDSVLHPYAWLGELDWRAERQRLLEELGRESI